MLFFIISAARLFYIALSRDDSHYVQTQLIAFERGKIVDRNGELLAVSRRRYNIYLTTKRELPDDKKAELKKILTLSDESLEHLYKKKKTYLLRRHVDEDLATQIRKLRADAVLLEPIYQRYYPHEKTLSHTLGFMSYDGRGLTGVEKEYDALLSSKEALRKNLSLKLTLDLHLQKRVERNLAKAVESHRAKSGTVIVQDTATGAILALAHDPSFDLNRFYHYKESDYLNRAVSRHIEPGSIFKIFFLAYLIETEDVSLEEKKYYSRGYYQLANGDVIRDNHAYGAINFFDIMKYSINSGIIEATQKITMNEMHDYLMRLQFGKKTGVDLPAEIPGILLPTRKWGLRTKANIPMGHGVAVTPLQLISSFSALVHDGKYRRPFIAKSFRYRSAEEQSVEKKLNDFYPLPLFSTNTVVKVRRLLEEGTSEKSTGEQSRLSGFVPIGKTSTSQVVNLTEGGYYRDRYNSIFIGAFPPDKPKVSILVILREPHHGGHSGGKVAAPLFSDILPEVIQRYQLADPRWIHHITEHSLRRLPSSKESKSTLAPELIGKSLRDALSLFDRWRSYPGNQKKEIKIKIEGQGIVKKQDPRPGEALVDGTLSLFLEDP